MKRLEKILVLVASVTVFTACSDSSTAPKEAITEIAIENVKAKDFEIEGMTCAMGCAATIQKTVADLHGVANSKVDYESGKAHFEFDETLVSEKEIIAAIQGVAEGQYFVKDWIEKPVVEEETNAEEKVSDTTEKTENI